MGAKMRHILDYNGNGSNRAKASINEEFALDCQTVCRNYPFREQFAPVKNMRREIHLSVTSSR